ncbi:hypothetical protein, partial [Methanothrix sp.]|uniref:hypothetical protein n=1 Tax=Methanothrix sp. TaxID=90426 RepID=UPI0034E25FF5
MGFPVIRPGSLKERSIGFTGGKKMSDALYQDVLKLVQNWTPRKVYHIEARYLDDLKNFIESKFTSKRDFFTAPKRTSYTIADGPSLNIAISKKQGQEVESLAIIFRKDLQHLAALKHLI